MAVKRPLMHIPAEGVPVIAFGDSVRCQTPVDHQKATEKSCATAGSLSTPSCEYPQFWYVEIHPRLGPRVAQGRGIRATRLEG